MFRMLYKKLCSIVLSLLVFASIAGANISYAAPKADTKTDISPAVKTSIDNEAKNDKITPVNNAEACNLPPYIAAQPLEVVQNPAKFLNQEIKMNATFDKFSTLGLDYKKALRPTADYIGFLIQRDDVVDHNIPLSEMKLFLKRDYAEKFIDLDTGDKIEIVGKVFSTALGDPWIDVNRLTIIKKAKTAETNNTKKK